jgi:hypothetical protein
MMGAGGEPATSGVEQHVYDLCRPQSLINPRRAWSWEKLATTLCDADAGTGPGVHGAWSRGHLVAGLPHGGDDHRAAAVREPVRQPGESSWRSLACRTTRPGLQTATSRASTRRARGGTTETASSPAPPTCCPRCGFNLDAATFEPAVLVEGDSAMRAHTLYNFL